MYRECRQAEWGKRLKTVKIAFSGLKERIGVSTQRT